MIGDSFFYLFFIQGEMTETIQAQYSQTIRDI